MVLEYSLIVLLVLLGCNRNFGVWGEMSRKNSQQNVSREYGDLLTSQQKYFNRYLYGNSNKNMTTYGNSQKSTLSKHNTSEPLYVNTTGWIVNPHTEEGKPILQNSQTAILKRLQHSVHEQLQKH